MIISYEHYMTRQLDMIIVWGPGTGIKAGAHNRFNIGRIGGGGGFLNEWRHKILGSLIHDT